MKTVFDAQARQELTGRLQQITSETRSLWGKMTAPQMLKHCRLWEESIHENKRYDKRPLIGRLIGPMILKSVLKNPDFRKNSPTIPELLITEQNIDALKEREQLIKLLNSYDTYDYPDFSFVHPFFGKMTREQIGLLAYKHLDHHLKQFGA